MKKPNNREFAEMEITKDAWLRANVESKAELQFDLLKSLHDKFDCHLEENQD